MHSAGVRISSAELLTVYKSCISWISDACTDGADTIRSYLHFSVPDVGPLTEYESWIAGLYAGVSRTDDYQSKKVNCKRRYPVLRIQ